MKKLVDDPQHVLREMLEGLCDLRHLWRCCNPRRLWYAPTCHRRPTARSPTSRAAVRCASAASGASQVAMLLPLPGLVAADPTVQPVEVALGKLLIGGHDQQLVKATARRARAPNSCVGW
jgi:hypothetical protein